MTRCPGCNARIADCVCFWSGPVRPDLRRLARRMAGRRGPIARVAAHAGYPATAPFLQDLGAISFCVVVGFLAWGLL